MAETLTPITNIANTPFTALIAAVNAIIGILAGDVVTANGSANGGVTVGNSYVSGILGASILAAGALRGGNVQAPADLLITSNVVVSNSALSVGNSTVNAVMNSTNLSIPTVAVTNAVIQYFPQSSLNFANVSITNIAASNVPVGSIVLDSFLFGTYRTAEYTLQVRDNAANNFQSSKLLVLHDGGTPLSTEYAQLLTNTQVVTFTTSANATSLILTATSTSANVTIRSVRTTLIP